MPVGLLHVAASTPQRHQRLFWDVCFEDKPLVFLRERLLEAQPDIVAIGLRNIIGNTGREASGNLVYYRRLVATVRAFSSATVVVGGSALSVMPEAFMGILDADFGVFGEAEMTFPALVAALETDDPISRLPTNVLYRGGGEIRFTGPAPSPVELDRLPPLDYALLDRRYLQETGTLAMQTKRGCAFACAFCTYPIIEGTAVRTRDPRWVAEELFRICDADPAIEHVFFVDSVFNAPMCHAIAICDALIERGSPMPWTCYANPRNFDEPLAEKMVASGAAGIEVGDDSGSDQVLQRLRKGFTTNAIRSLRTACRNTGLKDCHTFLLGTPDETMDDVYRTLDFIVELDPFAAIVMVWDDPVAPFSGKRQVLDHREGVLGVLEDHRHRFSNWVIPQLGHNFSERLFRVLRRSGLRGPLWQHIDRRHAP